MCRLGKEVKRKMKLTTENLKDIKDLQRIVRRLDESINGRLDNGESELVDNMDYTTIDIFNDYLIKLNDTMERILLANEKEEMWGQDNPEYPFTEEGWDD